MAPHLPDRSQLLLLNRKAGVLNPNFPIDRRIDFDFQLTFYRHRPVRGGGHGEFSLHPRRQGCLMCGGFDKGILGGEPENFQRIRRNVLDFERF